MSTLERLKKLFVEKLDFKEELLIPEATLESLGLDSLDKIEFVFSIEDEFKIAVPERDVKLDTIQDIVDVVDKLVAEQHGQP